VRRGGMSLTLSVFFDDPFWIGLFTLADENTVKHARVVFGKEPTDAELYEYFISNYHRLEFFDSDGTEYTRALAKNPKRRQREINKEIRNRIDTKKSYDAIKLSIQQSKKQEKRKKNRLKREEKEEHVFDAKRGKHKAKHRGH
jgi:hypothetical protein